MMLLAFDSWTYSSERGGRGVVASEKKNNFIASAGPVDCIRWACGGERKYCCWNFSRRSNMFSVYSYIICPIKILQTPANNEIFGVIIINIPLSCRYKSYDISDWLIEYVMDVVPMKYIPWVYMLLKFAYVMYLSSFSFFGRFFVCACDGSCFLSSDKPDPIGRY